jgi:hypothetical protein
MTKGEQMAALGYSVHERSCHVGRAWDFSAPGKGAMNSGMFKSEALAWAHAENHFDGLVELARRVVAVVDK